MNMSTAKIHDRTELRRRYEAGESVKILSESLGVSPMAVRNTLINYYLETYLPVAMDMLLHDRNKDDGREALYLLTNIETMGTMLVRRVFPFSELRYRISSATRRGRHGEKAVEQVAMVRVFEQHFDLREWYERLSCLSGSTIKNDGSWRSFHDQTIMMCRAPQEDIIQMITWHYCEYRKMLKAYVEYQYADLLKASDAGTQGVLVQPVNDARLSTRASNALAHALIWSHADLFNITDPELLKLRNVGKKRIPEINGYCAHVGMKRAPRRLS